MRITRSLFFLMLAFLVVLPVLKAQDQSEPPLNWGGFQVQGSASAGYRFTDVKGYKPMYEELYNLKDGPRLMDFNMFGHNDNPDAFANDFSLTTSGLGGDPYPAAQFTLSKGKLYDLRANWRQSYFYWNQNDNVIIPTLGVPGLTDNHDWATVRKVGSIDFTIHATNNLRFSFQYYHTSFSGPTFSTFSPAYLDQPGSWGSYARANAYSLYAPTFDNANRFTGGIDYTWHEWNFHYNVGYQTFDDNLTMTATSPGELSIAETPGAPLFDASWSDYRRLTTPVSEFSYTGKPNSWMSMRGSYLFYRYSGPATLDQSFSGVNPATTYSITQSGRSNVSEPNNIVQQGFTFFVKPWWSINVDYRYSRFTTDTSGDFTSSFTGITGGVAALPVVSSETADNNWKFSMHEGDITMIFTPANNLVISPGVSLYQSDVEAKEDGVVDPARTLLNHAVSPILSAFYRPTKWFDIRGEIHTFNNGASYTALTPHTNTVGRVVGNLHLNKKFTLSDELYLVSQQLLATQYHGKMQNNSIMLNYTYSPKYSLFAGFTYDNEFASGVINYWEPRGQGPWNQTLRDQALNRIWQAGLAAQPSKYFGFRFTGNYLRTTGLGQESMNSPVYGPLTSPYATGTVYFNFPKAGTLSVDLQRTYYIQQIITANNFSANMLTIRWTRDF
ncbi:MAG: hypothetical protein P8Z30_12280 [Acidobacteriota bacterium]